jgi:hypothetical protein
MEWRARLPQGPRAEAAWASARRTPHPAGCFTEPVRLERPLEDYSFTRTYIKATGEPRPEAGGPFWAAADRAMASPAWAYREIATNHRSPATGRRNWSACCWN